MMWSDIQKLAKQSGFKSSNPGYRLRGLCLSSTLLVIICSSLGIYVQQMISQENDRSSHTKIISEDYGYFNGQDKKVRKVRSGDIVRLKLSDGNVYIGELVEKSRETIIIQIVGIDTEFATEKVVDITVEKNFEDYYKELRELIHPQSFADRFRLCQWIHSRGYLELAEQELEELLADNPKLEEAQKLLSQVRAELTLDSKNRGVPGVNRDISDTRDLVNSERARQYRYLNKDEINLLKIYEVDLKDPPTLLIAREVISNLLNEYRQSSLIPETQREIRLFYRNKPIEILDIIFQLKAESYYAQVRVLGEPKAFNRFRHDIHRKWLINSCAAARCHGGLEAGRLFLHNRSVNSDRVVYTNFLILDRSTTEQGKPLINYDKPEQSPLFQMGLPTNIARNPHPFVPGWKPVFENTTDPLFTNSVDWIRLMYQPHPAYAMIKFTPPNSSSDEATPETSANSDDDDNDKTVTDNDNDVDGNER